MMEGMVDFKVIMKECRHPDCTFEFAAHIMDDYCYAHSARTPDTASQEETPKGHGEDNQ